MPSSMQPAPPMTAGYAHPHTSLAHPHTSLTHSSTSSTVRVLKRSWPELSLSWQKQGRKYTHSQPSSRSQHMPYRQHYRYITSPNIHTQSFAISVTGKLFRGRISGKETGTVGHSIAATHILTPHRRHTLTRYTLHTRRPGHSSFLRNTKILGKPSHLTSL